MRSLIKNESGDAVVEATFLFPIIIMVFAALVLLSMYLPQRANLQRATQYAATIAAFMQSDTNYVFDTESMTGAFDAENRPTNVYVNLFNSFDAEEQAIANEIIYKLMAEGFISRDSTIEIESIKMENYLVYKVISLETKETIQMPVSLNFVGFGDTLTIKTSARCVVQNGDEFVRNMDIAADLVTFLDKKLGISDAIGELFSSVKEVTSYFNF